jgi:hypothetical protein
MKNKLFGIDVQMHKGNNNTEVVFWRRDPAKKSGCTRKTIPVKTDSTLDRLYALLPTIQKSITVWPSSDYLSIDYSLLDYEVE